MLEATSCNICGSQEADLLYAGNLAPEAEVSAYLCTSHKFREHGPIVRCSACGFVYASPRRSSAEIQQLYEAAADSLYVAEVEGRRRTFQQAVLLLERFVPQKGRVLDVGCHSGLFLSLACAAGWEVYGVEPSAWAASYAQSEYGLDTVLPKDLRACAFETGFFDAVTMWDVLEHFTDPSAELSETHRILADGGVLVLTTIDIGSLVARVLGKRWWWLMEMHLCYFTRESLARLLTKTGFVIVDMFSHTRYISLRYLLNRGAYLCPPLAPALRFAARVLPVGRCIPVNLGDVVTAVARRHLA